MCHSHDQLRSDRFYTLFVLIKSNKPNARERDKLYNLDMYNSCLSISVQLSLFYYVMGVDERGDRHASRISIIRKRRDDAQ